MKIKSIITIFAITSILFYLPLFIHSSLLLNRGNDLEMVFWPVFHYIRETLLSAGKLPLWNSLFFAGTPLISDPQFSYLYPPNWLFILLPTNPAFYAYFLLHTFLSGSFFYLLLKKGLRFDSNTSILISIIYMTNPLVAGYLEAGHYGLVATHAWIPLLTLSFINVYKTKSTKWSILLAVSFAGLFLTHTIVFLYSALFFSVVTLFLLTYQKSSRLFLSLSLSGLIFIGLTAVTLLPQIAIERQTTRFLLLNSPDIYPKWSSLKEIVLSSVLPYQHGIDSIRAIPTEKWIPVGLLTLLISFFGFLSLPKKMMLSVSALAVVVFILMANSLTPFFPYLIKIDYYVLSRVSTRVWFIPVMIFSLLSAIALKKLFAERRRFAIFVVVMLLAENIFISWAKLTTPIKPIPQTTKLVDKFQDDKTLYRVLCLDQCISQKYASIYGLELVEGYNTLQLKKYFESSWALMGGYWGYYTLSVPPFSANINMSLNPDATTLGEWNTKYVISSSPLSSDFTKIAEENNLILYENTKFTDRFTFIDTDTSPNILDYGPDKITIDTTNQNGYLRFATVYIKGWKSFVDGQNVQINETPNHLMQIEVPENSKIVTFVYSPDEYKVGLIITSFTIFLLSIWFIKYHFH